MTQRDETTADQSLVGQVLRLVDQVGYQDGSVVSKTIVKKNTGTVTLFAFDRGQGLSEHTTPFDALVWVLDGEVEVTISGDKHRLREGDALIMPADVPHALYAVERYKMALVMIHS